MLGSVAVAQVVEAKQNRGRNFSYGHEAVTKRYNYWDHRLITLATLFGPSRHQYVGSIKQSNYSYLVARQVRLSAGASLETKRRKTSPLRRLTCPLNSHLSPTFRRHEVHCPPPTHTWPRKNPSSLRLGHTFEAAYVHQPCLYLRLKNGVKPCPAPHDMT